MAEDLNAAPLAHLADGPPSAVSSEADQRKLWFEYVKALNERRSQSAQRSGLTSYALLAVAAGIGYRFIPDLPLVWKSPTTAEATLLFFLLQADIFLLIATTLFQIAAYCAEGVEFRVFPEHWRRLTQIANALAFLLLTSFATAHLFVAFGTTQAPTFVRYTTGLIGAYWLLSSTLWAVREGRTIRMSVINKVPIPRYAGLQFEPSLFLAAFAVGACGVLAIASGISLVMVQRSLAGGWVQAWKAGSIALAFVTILLYLLARWAQSVGESSYLALERDIVLENLSVEEIRARFIERVIGRDAAQWASDVLREFEASVNALQKYGESLRTELQEIESLGDEGPHARSFRAQKLTNAAKEQFDDYRLSFRQFKFRMELFFQTYLAPRDRAALDEKRQDFLRALDRADKLLDKFVALTDKVRGLTMAPSETAQESR